MLLYESILHRYNSSILDRMQKKNYKSMINYTEHASN